MSLVIWIGNAPFVKQQGTITPVAANGAVYTVGIPNTTTGKTVSYTASGAATVNEIVNALVPLLQAMNEGEFKEVTWSIGSGAINWTVNEAGRPVTIASTTSGGGSLTTAQTVAPSSPYDANIAANYLNNALPIAADDLRFDQGNRDVKWNLSALSAIALTSWTRTKGYTGKIGLDDYNSNGNYEEYRATEFTIKATTWNIEQAPGDRAEQIKINAQTTQGTFNINGQAAGSLNNERIRIRANNAANVLNLASASVSVSPVSGLASNFLTVNAANSTLRGGTGVVWGTINNNGSTVQSSSNIANLIHQSPASRTILAGGAGTTTKTDLQAGRITAYGASTLTAITIGDGGTLDLEQDNATRTISGNVTMNAGSSFLDKYNTVASWTLKNNAPLGSITVRVGSGRTVAFS